MSHILVRQIIGERHEFAGKDWWYEFGPEVRELDVSGVKTFVEGKERAFAALAKAWTDESNTEWLCRVFSAAKMILASSVMLSGLEHARRTNLKICVPYLQYYSLLYSFKALVVLLPNQQWGGGALIEQKHDKTINVAMDVIARLAAPLAKKKGTSQWSLSRVRRLKAFRELISYRAPSDGGSLEEYDWDVLPLCKVAVELAQMASEILEAALTRHSPPGYIPKLVLSGLECVFNARIGQEVFHDSDDKHRIHYFVRKHPWPTNILHAMSEGHVEDFFGSWADREGGGDGDEVYGPDWRILFDVP